MKKIKVLIGHRGVGKTALGERLSIYLKETFCDLDAYISEQENKSISQIFLDQGENSFRELEKKYFFELIHKSYFSIISVGAGFNSDLIPKSCEIIYVSRRTDSDGRIFLNRPRLNPEMDPLKEYQFRYRQREPYFRKNCHWVYHMPEGLSVESETEKQIFLKSAHLNQKENLKTAYYTLTNLDEWPHIAHLKKFELRSDLLQLEVIHKLIDENQDSVFLVSIRTADSYSELKKYNFDWALELGEPPRISTLKIISTHHHDFNFALKQLNFYKGQAYLKLCPIVKNIEELIKGYQWQQEDPQNRSFLPRTEFNPIEEKSHKSLWRWFRILMFFKQKINFIQSRIDFDDQPSLFEFLNFKNGVNWGAVLGDPIHHSMTPVFQSTNMESVGSLVAIPISQQSFIEYWRFLNELGLRFAALTSPLKAVAAQTLRNEITISNSVEAINSLVYDQSENKWMGMSTDQSGFQSLIRDLEQNSHIIIWGGSGVLQALKKITPQAVEYSARTGQPKTQVVDQENLEIECDVVVWAAPRFEGLVWPSKKIKPRVVLDLNYTDSSAGLEYAQSLENVIYISGHDMFYAQGLEQAKFWRRHINKIEI